MSDERIEVLFGAQIVELLSGVKEAEVAVKEGVESMKVELESLSETASLVAAPLVAITAILEGGEIFKESIEKTSNLAVNLEVMSQKTGMSVEELSRFQYAADLSHVTVEMLSTGVQRLARGMEETLKGTGPASEAFTALGIRAANASGQLRPMNEVMLDIANRFNGMQDGAGKTALAMDLFGRSGANLIPFLNQGADGIERLQNEADRLGITMGEKDVAAAVAYEEAMKRWHGEVDAIERTLVVAFLPALSSIADAMTEGENHTSAFATVGHLLGDALRIIASTATLAWTQVLMYKDVVGSLIHGENPWPKIKQDAEDAAATIRKIWGTVDETPKPPEGPKTAPPGVTDPGARMRALEAQWLAEKEANKENFGELAQLELAFLKDKLSTVTAGSADYLTIQRRIASLDEEIAKSTFSAKLESIRAQEALDKDDKQKVVEDRKQELDEIRKHYAEASKEVQEGIRRVNEAQEALITGAAKDWKAAADAIPKAFSDATSQIGKSVTDMRGFFREMFLDLTRMSLEWSATTLRDFVATELAKKEITVQGALEYIAIHAWKAAAAAFTSVAEIPVVGPFLAPAAAAGAAVAVLGLAGNIHSAAGGFDVPAGINPMTQLHAQEMVLPADLANKIRGMAGDGGGDTHHWHVSTMDAQSFHRYLQANSDAVGDAAAKAVKSGRLTAKKMGMG